MFETSLNIFTCLLSLREWVLEFNGKASRQLTVLLNVLLFIRQRGRGPPFKTISQTYGLS